MHDRKRMPFGTKIPIGTGEKEALIEESTSSIVTELFYFLDEPP